MKLSPSYLKSIDEIKRKFPDAHIKVEFEGDLTRNEDPDYETCDECDQGQVDCSHCEGLGYISETNALGVETRDECINCYGSGYETCDYCNGNWDSIEISGSGWSEDACGEFILDWLADHAPKTRNALVYSEFYNDTSVDSEFTFTLPIEHAHGALDVMRAWQALADQIGEGCDTENAGMHLTIMPSGNYNRLEALPVRKIANFKREVTKLLPALFFAASCSDRSRGLRYRMPKIDAEDKYSAIYTHNDTCLEYRLFETCYERPEALLDYIEVIAKTLRYFSNERVEAKFSDFAFSDGSGVKRFFDSPEALRVLDETLPLIKPIGKSVKRLKVERRFDLKRGEVRAQWYKTAEQYKQPYGDYLRQCAEMRASEKPMSFEVFVKTQWGNARSVLNV